jgi:hypothetical protein
MACFSTPSVAQQLPSTPPAPAKTPAKTPATNAAPVAPTPPDTMGRYGNIVVPSDQVDHPLKLKMPFPDVGEIKIPDQDELAMRDKLESLAKLSDAEIRTQLAKWPPFLSMSLRDEGLMLQHIQDFRDYRMKVAMQKAHDMGLLTLTPEEKARFEKDYWDKRLQMDRDLARQFDPVFKAREEKLRDELFREFSPVSAGPVAQAGKMPTVVVPPPPIVVAPTTNQPAQARPPAAQNKSAASGNSVPAVTNAVQPVAQAPR